MVAVRESGYAQGLLPQTAPIMSQPALIASPTPDVEHWKADR